SQGGSFAAFVIRVEQFGFATGGDASGFVRACYALACRTKRIGSGDCAILQRESETTMPTPGPRTRPPRRRRRNPLPREASPTGAGPSKNSRLGSSPIYGGGGPCEAWWRGLIERGHLDGQIERCRRRVRNDCLPAALPAPSPLRCLLGEGGRYGARHFRVRHAPA